MATSPEFPPVGPDTDPDEFDLTEEVDIPLPGEGLIEPAGVPFDEEGERVMQPEPVGD